MSKHLCIFGAGGSGKDTFWLAKQCGRNPVAFIDPFKEGYLYGVPIEKESFFCPTKHMAIVAIGNPHLRKKIVDEIQFLHGDCFDKLIHPTTNLTADDIKIGSGAVICANCVLTCNINLGDHSQLNVATTICHDVKMGDFFTTAPGVRISGCVEIGDFVYCGTNSSIIEKIKITNNVTIGACACVVKDITEIGTYIGVPAQKK